MSGRQSLSLAWLLPFLAFTFFNPVQANRNVLSASGKSFTYDSENRMVSMAVSGTAVSMIYNGGGNVRNLTNSAGAVTDTYEYDAFGNSFTVSGTTPNNSSALNWTTFFNSSWFSIPDGGEIGVKTDLKSTPA